MSPCRFVACLVLACGLCLSPVSRARAQEIRVFGFLVVTPFVVANDRVAWPYEATHLRTVTIAEFKTKGSIHGRFQIVSEPPADPVRRVYTLSGEIISWSPGERAVRMIVGGGAGRESAIIHFWVTDDQGQRVYEHRDTIRAEYAYNAEAGSAGQLARPFALKLVERVSEGKWQQSK